jgi:hypothetical protein
MSSDDAVSFTTGAGGASFASLGLVPADIDIALAFSIDLAKNFTDDAVLSSDDASGAGFTLLDLVPVMINITLAFSSGFLCIFFVDLVNVAMVNLAKILFFFVS